MTVSGPRVPGIDEVLGYFESLSNWGRWGADDEAGTLNYITDEKRRDAAALIREGRSVSCSLVVATEAQPDQILGAPQRYMIVTGEEAHPEDPPAQAKWGPI